ncbi:hypothetical protein RSOLAG22IIIB_03130 [Rhizoctonia solani]|uniref:Peptidase C14 caspase domain-containing protein n=1 Tax=Rhizoctonia solani TaxID=456999 RepID=A0A0K6FMU7_9AGAM|nr:hypothetical protein RSOLAG22IIIB_03130 [Rhizoctonia solani]
MEVVAAMKKGDNLPNTKASLGARVKRRALLVAVHYESDMRNTQDDSLHIPTSPLDVLRVYRMLLTRGYEPQNIRILVEGLVRDYRSNGTKRNIIDSLEWLSHGAEPGDHRYFHFSGHGYAYEVDEEEGKMARVSEQPSLSPFGDHIKFYREALLTNWETPNLLEIAESEGPIMLDAYNRINDEELKAMVSKFPKGCILTMTLDCFHGAQMRDVIFEEPTGQIERRGEVGWPIDEPEPSEPTTNPSNAYPDTSPCNLFVPPVFRLYSDFNFDPNVTMESVPGPGVLDGVQAKVCVWSGYSNSLAQSGVFTSAFASTVEGLTSDVSHREVFQELNRKVGENTEGKGGYPFIQLQAIGGSKDEVEAPMNKFVI